MTMTTQLSTKLAALAVALLVNGLMIGGVGYLFSGDLHQRMTADAVGLTAAARVFLPTL